MYLTAAKAAHIIGTAFRILVPLWKFSLCTIYTTSGGKYMFDALKN